MNKFNLLLVAVILAGGSSVLAQEGQSASEGKSSIKIEDASGKKNKVDGDIDEDITNPKLRAESGSKSKLSLSTRVNYQGGSVSRGFGSERPNIRGNDPSFQERTGVGAGIDARYRWTKNDSVTVGTELSVLTPFQGDLDSDSNQLNWSDPSIGYSRVGKLGNFQTNSAVGVDIGTSKETRAVKQEGSMAVSVNGLYVFQNGAVAGLATALSYFAFKNGAGEPTDARTQRPGYYGGDRRVQYSLGVFPFAEYSINDRYALRTVFGYFNWMHLYGDAKTTRLLQQYVYQSVGFGIAVTRDVYLYPNVQFIPDDIRSDYTNVAMSATINIF
jgi:hypothetical protein